MGKLSVPWNRTSLKQVTEALKLPPRDLDGLHHAGEDARHLALVFCALMNL